jgi:Uncharacterized protein conserved in bacteria (DUF2330)
MRRLFVLALAPVLALAVSAPAWACGGLIGPNGTVSLGRTTTLAGYHDGIEHYVTSFSFEGAGGAFGSIVPLPGVPSKVERGGDWTLQRLERETAPREFQLAGAGSAGGASTTAAKVILQTRVDSLDLTVLQGGGASVGTWATENGFRLPPDAPEVLDFYASRSPIFLAARFDADAARRQGITEGAGTPIHLTIPTSNPWVPLRILALGKKATEFVQADVYLLTDARPALLPASDAGIDVARNERASDGLLTDLRADKGMSWIPPAMWLTYLRLNVPAGLLRYDLAVDAHGTGHPSPAAAGFQSVPVPKPSPQTARTLLLAVAAALAGLAAGGLAIRRARPTAA